tara:strand:+ start:821 stop:943 length:123 start_codon:yes stop_codon:yes gene_type:complete
MIFYKTKRYFANLSGRREYGEYGEYGEFVRKMSVSNSHGV